MMESALNDPFSVALCPPGEFPDEVFTLPASFAQQRLWFLDQLEPGSPFYNIPAAVRLRGYLDARTLELSLQEVIHRHETLRTTFLVEDGQPVQMIATRPDFSLRRVDLGSLPPEKREAEARQLADCEARTPFDLGRGPLIRARLLQLDPSDHVLLLTLHHIISDGWSMGVLIHETAVLYAAFAAGLPSPFPELPIQYGDFAVWQRERLKGGGLEKQAYYWKSKLGGELPALKMPTDRPRPAEQSFHGASQSRALPAGLVGRLNEIGRREDATLFMVLLAAFQVLLYRYTGQEDFCIGAPIANRTRSELEGLIGLFVNTLVLRADLGGEPVFRDLLRRVRATTLEAYTNQDLPFDTLVEMLHPERDLSQSPLFQVMFILQNAPARGFALPDLAMDPMDLETGTSTFDLTFSLAEHLDGMDVSVEYNVDLFDADTIEQLMVHFQVLLEGIASDPGRSIAALPLLTEAERERLTVGWNNTSRTYAQSGETIQRLFSLQAASAPDAVAVVWEPPTGTPGTAQHLSYRELDERANRLANHLVSLGIGPDVPVGICLERSADLVVSILGVLKAGGAYLPLDPASPTERMGYLLSDAGVPLLITQESLRLSLPACKARILCLDSAWDEISCHPASEPAADGGPENLAYLVYTSASTGNPKGVLVRQRNLVNQYLAWEEAYHLRDLRTHLQMANVAFDVFSGDLVRALCSGGTLVLCPREYLLSPRQLYELIRQEQVDCAEFVPAVLRELGSYLKETAQDLSMFRLLICGSDTWYMHELLEIQRLCGPGTRLVNSFGLTETTIDSAYYDQREIDLPLDSVVPIGRPFPNTTLYILDKHLQPVPLLASGELYVGGAGVSAGYHNQPQRTAERFLPDPFSRQAGARLYKTGDLARYRKDGQIEFLGRLDYQVKVRGYRVELGEIESVLHKHPAVRDAVVMARRPGRDGPAGRQQHLVAYLVTDIPVDRIPIQVRCTARHLPDRPPLPGNGKAVELEAADLSERGACLVSVPQSWETGDAVALTVFLPGQEAGMSISGRIVWRQGTDAGLVFEAQNGEREVLARALRRYSAALPMPDPVRIADLRHNDIRVPYEGCCRLTWGDGQVSETAVENISTGGLRLAACGRTWERGASVGIHIQLPGEGAWLSTKGTVWWVQGEQAGIRFEADAAGNARIGQAVEALLQSRGFSMAHLRAFLKARLPETMIPSQFVLLDALPLTPNGKVDRKALPEPDWARQDWEEQRVAPRTPTEETLVGIWATVLGLEANRISVFDNFFELGGHSLLATQLSSRIREAFRVELPLRKVFEAPTVAGLAEALETARRSQVGSPAGPIVPQRRDEGSDLPLSFAQQRLWFLDQLEPDNPSYNISEAVRLRGEFDLRTFEQALNEVVRRHDTLRTSFHTVDGRPVQRIAPHLHVPVQEIDLQPLSPDERAARLLSLVQEEAQKPFDLGHAPLLRVQLIRLADSDNVLLYTMHHIIGDDWSTNIFIGEISALYPVFQAGLPSPLDDLPIQYADFAVWQREWLSGEELDRQMAYWTEKLAGTPPLLDLPTDHPRPPVQTYRGAYQAFHLPDELSTRLKALSQQEGATLFMTLLAAFQVLLSRYAGQEDFCIGTPIANRTRGELENLIGFFVNTLVLRADLSGEPGFRQLVRQVRETAFGAYAHQDLPFEKIVDALAPERNLSHSPLFQVMFVLQNAPQRGQGIPGLSLEPVEAHSGTAKFDLTLFMLEEEGHLAGAIEYNTDLFDGATITRMMSHFQVLLEGIVADPDQVVGKLPLMSAAERQQVLLDWNRTQAPFPEDRTVHELFEEQVLKTPDAIALRFGDQSLTYRELDRRANQLAHALRRRGVQLETRVGVCLERSLELMIALLGVWKAGGAYVPLDPNYPPERLAFMLDDSQAPILLTQDRLRLKLAVVKAEVLCLDSGWEAITREPGEGVRAGPAPDSLAYVIYTSGSTGKPKGAMIEHKGLVNYLTWCLRAYPLATGQGTPVHSSISFDLTVTSLFPALLAGKAVTLLSEDLGVEALGETLRREAGFSLVKITPAHLKLLGEQLSPDQAAGRTHAFIIGGENLLADHVDFWQRNAPRTELVNEYGPTETVVGCCVYWAPPGKHTRGVIPIGRPIINTSLYVLDRYREPVPIGVRGELYIGGAGVCRGYLNRPELTAERFLPDPFHPGSAARMYRTGDLVRYLPDGNLECLGRMDFQVKIRGFRVELEEIESTLAQHPGIREGAVWVREDEGVKRLVAYLVALTPENAPAIAELRAFMLERLPDYMVPAGWVWLDTLPLTPNGKVDRKKLPAVTFDRQLLDANYQPPSTRVEIALADIWRQVLRIDRVGALDNFFSLGGDSILTIQVVSRARQMGLHITPRELFEHPTLRELAKAARAADGLRTEQGLVEGSLVLTPVQRWFFSLPLAHRQHWNQSVLLSLPERVDPQNLETALLALLAHHDALRLAFRQDDQGTWYGDHLPLPPRAPLEWVDLPATASQEARLGEAYRWIQESLDLANGPLLRAGAYWLGEGKGTRVLLAAHHLVVDAVSWRILLEDLLTAYRLAGAGQPVVLPPKTTSFKEWSQRLHSFAQQETIRSQADYWFEMAARPGASLPVDFHPGNGFSNREADSASLSLHLDVEQTRQLLTEAAPAYHTDVHSLLLAGLLQALRAETGCERWVLCLEGHGREEIDPELDVSRTVGWFTSQYPLALEPRGEGVEGALEGVEEALARLPGRGLGFGLLREFHPEEPVRNALEGLAATEITFNYLGQFDTNHEPGSMDLVGDDRGPERGPEDPRTAIWDISAGITAGQLQIEVEYNTRLHRRETVERFARRMLDALHSLIEEEAGLFTMPSDDFFEFGWDKEDMDKMRRIFGDD
jgi:amino acid adenylation domain-containing protein/non-ribosomal peptide synthase protein (TIGR01720 family)